MTITEMLGQSITLTLLGMGVVFGFLVLLILFLNLIRRLVEFLKLDVEEETASVGSVAGAPAQSTVAVIAAIAAAVKEKQK